MTGSIFDKPFDSDGHSRPDDRNRSVPRSRFGSTGLPPTAPPTAPLNQHETLSAEIFGGAAPNQSTYRQPAPHAFRPRSGGVLIAVGSLAAGVFAAGGAATALAAGGDPTVALASSGSSSPPSDDGDKKPAGDENRDKDAPSHKGKPDRCVRLDEKTLAAIQAARAGGPAARADHSRKTKVQVVDGDVLVPLDAVSVVKCKWPAKGTPMRGTGKTKTPPPGTSSTRPPKPTSTRTTPLKTTATAPRATRTTSRTSTSTPAKTTTTSKAPTPKPTTSTAS
ncbi:hypothetical protein [Kineosporia sp. A_224]|uniref:hypothetical protein n=1 Tax=Kineosporia sp. A_224 TaxID=1962180 RepID=UPI00117BA112|nr:hypothetical protein [Kineosporia sp. A_224]